MGPTKATPPYGLAVWAIEAITTEPRCCGGSHPSVIPAGTRGTATARRQDFRATNVTFRGHPHPILCLRSMIQTRSDRPTRTAVDQWVHDLNTLARRLDDPPHEIPTATAPYRRLAQRGPTNRTRRGAADHPYPQQRRSTMETIGHCLRCGKSFTGEFCPRCDTDRLPPDQPPAGLNATEGVVHHLYAEACAGVDPQTPSPPHLTITASSSRGARVVVRTAQPGQIDRFCVGGGQVQDYGLVTDPDPSVALTRLLLRGRI